MVGNEARDVRSQEQIMEGLEWLVSWFELCPVDSTGCQQRFFWKWNHIIRLFLQEYHSGLSVEDGPAWRNTGGPEVSEASSASVIFQTKDKGPLVDNDLHLLIFTALCNPLPWSAGWTYCLAPKNRIWQR